MDQTDQIEQVRLIYAAATDRERWKPFLDSVCGSIGAEGGNVVLNYARDCYADFVEATHVTPEQTAAYNAGIGALDYSTPRCVTCRLAACTARTRGR